MTHPPGHVAVIDIGKTNAKAVLVDLESLSELAIVTRPNSVIRSGPYPHYDAEAIWAFILGALADLNREHKIDVIVVTTHGASCALLDVAGELAMPVLDYEHDGPDDLAAEYDAIRPPFAETGSPRLPGGLNLGAQLFWQQSRFPEAFTRTASILTYPQYWAFRLSGVTAMEVTSLGVHTDLWNPFARRYSSLVERLDWRRCFPPIRGAGDALGVIRPEIAAATGLSPDLRIHCGIHDSNASLLPHLLWRTAPFSVVSTGTWVIAMAIGGTGRALDPERDTLINIDVFGQPVRSARFMGGREHAILTQGREVVSTEAEVAAVLAQRRRFLPSLQAGSGPFPRRKAEWRGQGDPSPGEMHAAVSFYLALMTSVCLELIGADGPIITEGPFAHDGNYLRMLAAATGRAVVASINGATGTQIGAALLATRAAASPFPTPETAISNDAAEWLAYAAEWRSSLQPERS